MTENKAAPICPACGEPVEEKYKQSRGSMRAGDYLRVHRRCRTKYAMRLRRQEERRAADELDEALNLGRQTMVNAADDLRIAIEDRNEEAKQHDPEVVRLMYLKCRQAILTLNIEPDVVSRYEDRWIRGLAADIGSDGMDVIADRVRWVGPRRWRDDPEVSREGRLPLVIGRELKVPEDVIGEDYRDDLNMDATLQKRTIGVEQALRYIWEKDHIGRNVREEGPWRLKRTTQANGRGRASAPYAEAPSGNPSVARRRGSAARNAEARIVGAAA